jgi:Thiol-disulfide isomerase and thioredoxins
MTRHKHEFSILAAAATATTVAATAALSAVPSPAARAAAADDPAPLKVVAQGASRRLGGYMPQRLALTDKQPASVTKLPANLRAPRYGTLAFGPNTVTILLDEPATGDARLYVDANGNGDLTDDAPVPWQKKPYAGDSPLVMHQGAAMAPLSLGGRTVPVSLNLYRFDPKDDKRPQLKDVILYYRDYALEGEAQIGGKTYRVMLDDRAATGDFSKPEAVDVAIDVNGNGVFDRRGEKYGAAKPFNIGGTTYEVKPEIGTAGEGSLALRFTKSAQTVAEVLPPPDLSAGRPAVPFSATTTDGKALQFPSSYKGKVVLVDFWATWCGPCIAELPNLTRVYEAYKDKGLDVLGISLDQENALEKLTKFTKERNMPWPQIYDGKYWKAEIAQLYAVDAIPAAYLVDGDTGTILASGNALRGEALEKTVREALAKKAAR